MPTTPAAAFELRDFCNAYGQPLTLALYAIVEELAAPRGIITLAEVLTAEVRLAGR